MKHSLIALILILSALSFNAHARKPAVEDVFTVIPADYDVVPKGMEAPMNFTKKVPVLGKMDTQETPSNGWVALLGLLAMISLPMLMWFGITAGQQTMEDEVEQAHEAPASNVSNLDDYRKDDTEEHKKAS